MEPKEEPFEELLLDLENRWCNFIIALMGAITCFFGLSMLKLDLFLTFDMAVNVLREQ